MEDRKSISLGTAYDLYAYYQITDDGQLYIEAGWYKKSATPESWNNLNAIAQVSVNGQTVLDSGNIGFDMRDDPVGTYRSFWSTTMVLQPVELLVYVDMAVEALTPGTITWSIAVGLMNIGTGAGFARAVPHINTGAGWVQAIPYVHDGVSWKMAT